MRGDALRPVTLQLHDVLAKSLVPIVQEIGLRGLPFDVARRDQLVLGLSGRLGELDARLRQSGITEQASPKKLGWRLLSLGVPLTTRTKGGGQHKVDLEVLGRLNWEYNTRRERAGKQAYYPFLGPLIEHAKLTKAREGLEGFVPCFDGKLRTRLNACSTRTARYSSSSFGTPRRIGYCPVDHAWGTHGANLQNVPRKDETYGVNVKECFVAQEGWALGELDYRALELFVEAYRTTSQLAIGELEGGADIHTANAQRMFGLGDGVPVSKSRRTLAKNFRYALRGGGGDRSIQIALAKGGEFVELHEISPWRKAIFDTYPEIEGWIAEIRDTLQQQKRDGRVVIRNAFQRPRVLLGGEPLKEALATEISGTAADVMNFALLRVAIEHPRTYECIVAQIHDSFVVYAPSNELREHMEIVRDAMTRPVWVWEEMRTLQVDMKIGSSWGNLTEAP